MSRTFVNKPLLGTSQAAKLFCAFLQTVEFMRVTVKYMLLKKDNEESDVKKR